MIHSVPWKKHEILDWERGGRACNRKQSRGKTLMAILSTWFFILSLIWFK